MYLHHVSVCTNRLGVCVGTRTQVAPAPRNKACLRSNRVLRRVPFGLLRSLLSRWIPGTRKNTSCRTLPTTVPGPIHAEIPSSSNHHYRYANYTSLGCIRRARRCFEAHHVHSPGSGLPYIHAMYVQDPQVEGTKAENPRVD